MKKGLLLFGAAFMAVGASAQIFETEVTSQKWDFQAEYNALAHLKLDRQNVSGFTVVYKAGQNDRNTNKFKAYADTLVQVLPKTPYVFGEDTLKVSQVFVSSNSQQTLTVGGLKAADSDFFLGIDSLKAGDKIVVEYSNPSDKAVTYATGLTADTLNLVTRDAAGTDTLLAARQLTNTTAWHNATDTIPLSSTAIASGDTLYVQTVGTPGKLNYIAMYVPQNSLIEKVTIVRGDESLVFDYKGEAAKNASFSFKETLTAPVNFLGNLGEGKENRNNFGRKSYKDSTAVTLPIHSKVFNNKASFSADGLASQNNQIVTISELQEGQQVIVKYTGDTLVYSTGTNVAKDMVILSKGDTLVSGVSKVASGDTMLVASLNPDSLKNYIGQEYGYISFNPKSNNPFQSFEILTTEVVELEPLYTLGKEDLTAGYVSPDALGEFVRVANGQTFNAKIGITKAGAAQWNSFAVFGAEGAGLVGVTELPEFFAIRPDNWDNINSPEDGVPTGTTTLIRSTFEPSKADYTTEEYWADYAKALDYSVVDLKVVRKGDSARVVETITPTSGFAAWDYEMLYVGGENGLQEYGDLYIGLTANGSYLKVYEQSVTGDEIEKPIAGVDKYVAVKGDGTLADEFLAVVDESGNATNIDKAGNSVVEFGTENVKGRAVGSAVITSVVEDAEGSLINWDPDKQALRDDKKYSADTYNAASWTVKNEAPGSIETGTINVVKGTGNPSLNVYAEVFEGDNGEVNRAGYEAWAITKDANGNLTIPETAPVGGLYYEFETLEDGLLSIGVWVNKGNRQTIVYDKTDSTVVSYNKEGYVNGVNYNVTEGEDTKSYAYLLDNDSINAIHAAAFADKVDDQFVIAGGNQAFKGNLIINAQKAHTYMVLVVNTQIGFSGYTFTAGQENWIEIEELTIAEPEDTTAEDTTVVEPVEPISSLEGDIIAWNSTDVGDAATIASKYSAGDATLNVVAGSKAAIDANTAWFGTCAEDSIKLSYRLKPGAKTSDANSYTLTVPADGAVYVYVRSASSGATDRNLVLTQDGTALVDHIVLESDTVNVGGQKLYLPVAVNVKAGEIKIEAPTGALNFYGIRYVKGGEVAETVEPAEPAEAIVYVKADSKVGGEVYNLAGQIVKGSLKPGLYIKNGKLFIVK